ncbi:MAG TPA: MarR family transcriptional regulator [Lacunisphaera sp.]|nr:MarR family transcriptional regulator [Lacunisphaera sp.]
MPKKPSRLPTPSEYRSLSTFRHAIRKFLDFSTRAARELGLTSQQYQALLALKANQPGGPLSIGELARDLFVEHQSAVELVNRLEERRLVRRAISTEDGRRVEIHLTAGGEDTIAQLAATHCEELNLIGPEMRRVLRSLSGVWPEQPAEAEAVSRSPESTARPLPDRGNWRAERRLQHAGSAAK